MKPPLKVQQTVFEPRLPPRFKHCLLYPDTRDILAAECAHTTFLFLCGIKKNLPEIPTWISSKKRKHKPERFRVPQCPNAPMSQRPNLPASRCPSVPRSQPPSLPMSECPNVSTQFSNVLLSQCLNVAASQPRNVPVSQPSNPPASHCFHLPNARPPQPPNFETKWQIREQRFLTACTPHQEFQSNPTSGVIE